MGYLSDLSWSQRRRFGRFGCLKLNRVRDLGGLDRWGGLGWWCWGSSGGEIVRWVRVGFDDDDFLVGDDFFGGVEEGESIVGVVSGGAVFFVGEEFEGFGLEGESEFLEHFGDLRRFG